MKNVAVTQDLPSATDKPPGFLLEPFGRAIPIIVATLQSNPEYVSDFLYLSRTRMHLIGMGLAHIHDIPDAGLAETFFRKPAGRILDEIIGHRPTGLKRAIGHMPDYMMQAETYRALVQLLAEPVTARMIHHADRIYDSKIRMITDVPGPLRATIFSMHRDIEDMSSFLAGLRCIALRRGRSSLDELVSELASARQPDQFVARLKSIVDSLPLPDALPPTRVQYARRIDSGIELSDLGKRWQNCLDRYVWDMEHGRCSIYLWQHAGVQAACEVTRCGRFGWFLNEVRGPGNARIEGPDMDDIRKAFESAGILGESVINSIRQILE